MATKKAVDVSQLTGLDSSKEKKEDKMKSKNKVLTFV